MEIYPYLSSIQFAFAKMGERWQDAYFTSVHGRSMKGLAQRIDGKEKVAILTDEENSPNQIAHTSFVWYDRIPGVCCRKPGR